MKILLKKVNKKGLHFIKCEDNYKKKKKLGSYSTYQKNFYIRLNFRRLYYYLMGGAKFHLNKTYFRNLGNFDFFECLYLYEKAKSTGFSGFQRRKR